MLLARFKSLNTQPRSGLDWIFEPYRSSHSWQAFRKASFWVEALIWVSPIKRAFNFLAIAVFGLARHHCRPWRWIWTKQRCISIVGQTKQKARITVGLPSTVTLFGSRPFCLSSVNKLIKSSIRLSLKSYLPATNLPFSPFNMITVLILLFQMKDPSNIKYLIFVRSKLETEVGDEPSQWSIMRWIFFSLRWLRWDNCLTVYPSNNHRLNQINSLVILTARFFREKEVWQLRQ